MGHLLLVSQVRWQRAGLLRGVDLLGVVSAPGSTAQPPTWSLFSCAPRHMSVPLPRGQHSEARMLLLFSLPARLLVP